MNTREDIERICRKLHPLLGNRAASLWYAYLSSDEQSRRDLSVDIELLAEKLLRERPLVPSPILLNPPTPLQSTGSFLVGTLAYRTQPLQNLFLRRHDFIKQIGIFAITGEGKSNLAYLLSLQLLKNKTPFLVVDWKRSWRALLSLSEKHREVSNIEVFTVGRNVRPFEWNPFRPPPSADPDLWIGAIADVLEKSHLSGPGVAHFISKIFPRLLRKAGADFYPNFRDGMRELAEYNVRERELKWKQSAMRIFQSFTIGRSFKAFNSRNPVKLEELLDKPVILELDQELPKALRVFFCEILLRWIHIYRLHQGEADNLRHVLILEEAHNLFPRDNFRRETSDAIENIYREIRAFGQGLITITQHPSMLPVYLLGNCHTQIYFGLQHADDIRIARKSLFLPLDEESYFNQLRVGECIVKVKNRIDPCLVRVPLVPIQKSAITDDLLRTNTPSYFPRPVDGKQRDHPRYFLPDKENREIGKHPPAKSPPLQFLADIALHPLSSVTQRYRRLKLNPKAGNAAKNLLIAQGMVLPRNLTTRTGWLTLFDMTHKGRTLLTESKYPVKETQEGVVHRYWKEHFANYCREQGYSVEVEPEVNGKPDVVAKKPGVAIALEIETGKSYPIENIQRAISAGFNKVISIATSEAVKQRISAAVQKLSLPEGKVTVTTTLSAGSLLTE